MCELNRRIGRFLWVLFLAAAASARGYILESSAWRLGTVASPTLVTMQLQLQIGPPVNRTLLDGSTSWNQVAQAALAEWNQYLATVQFAWINNSTFPIPAGGNQPSGANTVFFSNTFFGETWGSGTIAITTIWSRTNSNRTTETTETDTIFNNNISWDSYRGPLKNATDFKRVALHEFGHTLGLDHPDGGGQSVVAIMNSHVSNLDDLAADDIAGAQYLYGLAPQILTQPASQAVALGRSATLSVATANNAALNFQWYKNTVSIVGATAASYTISSVQSSDVANYFVIASNRSGSATSSTASLTLPAPPAVTAQPQSQTVTAGAATTLSVAATGTGLTYQWKFNGAAILGATNPALTISNTGATAGGSYTVVVSDSSGNSVTSSAAVLTVQTNARLVNLSVLTAIQDSLTVGFVVGGPGGSATEPLLIRAVGPTLGAPVSSGGFAYSGVMPDPSLKVIRQADAVTIASNAGWGNPAGNPAQIRAADSATGAFPLLDPSLDSAVWSLLPSVSGGYAVQISGSSGDSGSAIAEIYDNTANYTPSSPRLVNLSCLKKIPVGGSLSMGFVVSGSTSETLLIRAAGPALTGFGYSSSAVMSDPKLVLVQQNTSAVLATNSGWGGNAQVGAAADSVAAFKFNDPSSKDSAILITLPPVGGGYSATVYSASSAGGSVIVEVYEVR